MEVLTAPAAPVITGRGQSWDLLLTTGTYRMPDGSQADWDILTGPGSVAVVALTGAHEVILARHYRPGPDTVLGELPGGMPAGAHAARSLP